ncbi:hypothetical protein PGTUg99_023235 [Puccinia graminis f. sp. tritici]|uniref:Uncharacterized protein n=1 Tax=Puccinia graminis f. sp. tritici TaxID=56615 RepID=A0A5B0PLU0_PUCGR|nr:hypothetical protein PGTUg99_023235 [Puccinia graminis f. sp. tritici]
MNVLTHCTIITIGDPPKKEAQEYFNESLLCTLQKKLDQQPICDTRDSQSGNLILKHQSSHQSDSTHHHQSGTYELGFDLIYDTFGGKLAHLQGFVGDYLNSGGKLKPKQSSPFLQAYALLQYHIVNTQHLPREADKLSGPISPYSHRVPIKESVQASVSQVEGLDRSHVTEAGQTFQATTLLYVISKFTSYEVERLTGKIVLDDGSPSSPTPKPSSPRQTYSYFGLSREVGVRSVDHLVRNRILDLRWTPPVSTDPVDPNTSTSPSDISPADVEPVVLPVSPVMRTAMQTVLDQHFKENLLR